MTPPTLAVEAPVASHSFRRSGRLPHRLRRDTIRRMSGRAWKGLPANDDAVGLALGMDRTNAGRRSAGKAGPYAATCEEVYQLETAGISTYALTAHLKSIAMQAQLRAASTEDLIERLRALQEEEQEASASMDCTQVHWLASNRVSLAELRDKAARQAALSEEITAIAEELLARKQD